MEFKVTNAHLKMFKETQNNEEKKTTKQTLAQHYQ